MVPVLVDVGSHFSVDYIESFPVMPFDRVTSLDQSVNDPRVLVNKVDISNFTVLFTICEIPNGLFDL